ncbi:bifunctional diguanylate cyclase/phosphodiesterase [Amphibacillus cookii]|uniref:sensor domain-containing protein n=1 Tax=Amphibacillus cookii TaxID=767787 RepID=UPI00195D1F93|nr:diguanylate cyclase [Amphibacillus cookii]MBM7540044.1 diguanylate cyclase (GGDEF)-like protein/PAS domain S-box-containing protein [Amphibacillus cookii]
MDLTKQALIDGMQDMVFVMRVSDDGKKFYYELVNHIAKKALNLTSEMVGKELNEVIPSTMATILTQQYQQVVQSKQTHTYEDNYFISNAGQKISETILTPLVSENKVSHIVAVTRDITNLKQVETQSLLSRQRLQYSRQRYKSLFDENTDAISYLNLSGKIVRMNRACEQLLKQINRTEDRRNIFDLISQQDLQFIKQTFDETLKGQAHTADTTVNSQDQYQIRLQIKFIPMIIEQHVQGVYAILKDMTAEHFAKDTLLASQERFRLIAEHSSDLIQLLDQDGYFVYLSPSHERVLGLQLIGDEREHIYDIMASDDHDSFNQHLKTAITYNKAQKFEVRFQNINADYCWFELQLEPVFSDAGIFKHSIVVARDIEARKTYEHELQRLAYHDPLTGLANRRLFNARLEQVISLYERNQKAFAVMMLDLDDFKGINDQMGHDTGDYVIEKLGKRLKQAVRDMDTVARLGGDEFIVLLPEIETKANLIHIIERIERTLQAAYRLKGNTFQVGVSLGAILLRQGHISASSVISKVDQVLYRAKRTGKNKSIIDVQF